MILEHVTIEQVIRDDWRATVQKLLLLFESEQSMERISNIHIYESAFNTKVPRYFLKVDHRKSIDSISKQ